MSLKKLKERLNALDRAALCDASMPMSTALQEATDLLQFVRGTDVQQKLLKVGQEPGFHVDLEERIQAAREAQSLWVSVRDQFKSEAAIELETRAVKLRSDLLAAGHYHLRYDLDAQATLMGIAEDEGLADLVHDLLALATLFEGRKEPFSSDQSFDVEGSIELARGLGQALSGKVTVTHLGTPPAQVREFRDRAFTYMNDLVSELRAAGRYAFRDQPEEKRFISKHVLLVRRRRASNGEVQPEPDRRQLFVQPDDN